LILANLVQESGAKIWPRDEFCLGETYLFVKKQSAVFAYNFSADPIDPLSAGTGRCAETAAGKVRNRAGAGRDALKCRKSVSNSVQSDESVFLLAIVEKTQ